MHNRGARILLTIFLVLGFSSLASSQTFHVLHTFTGAGDGGTPSAGLIQDRNGNFYGTTEYGAAGSGTVFKLSHSGSGWLLGTLYSFQGGSDGANPIARVIFGTDGSLYGTTSAGGTTGYGNVFRLQPQLTACRSANCPWRQTVLYEFQGGTDGGAPQYGDLTFDHSGALLGTAVSGGLTNCFGDTCGVVFKLTKSGNSWMESVAYSFTGGDDGYSPFSGVVFDSAGNLYGTAYGAGPIGAGSVYELTPSGSGYTETTLTGFESGGGSPVGGLTFDSHGNLFGTGFSGGTAFELQPSGGSWIYSLLYTFDGFDGPFGSPTLDSSGAIYGTNSTGGLYDQGFVFKLTPSGGTWSFTDLYDFTGGNDGGFPVSNVILDGSGNLYGTAYLGGSAGAGVIWQIMP